MKIVLGFFLSIYGTGIFLIGCFSGNFCSNYYSRTSTVIQHKYSDLYNLDIVVKYGTKNCTIDIGTYNTMEQAYKESNHYRIGSSLDILIYPSQRCEIDENPGKEAALYVLFSSVAFVILSLILCLRKNEETKEENKEKLIDRT